MQSERQAFDEGTKGLSKGMPAHVQQWAWNAAWKRFKSACEAAREKHGAETEYEAIFSVEGPQYARFVMLEELIRAARDHNTIVAERKPRKRA